MHFAVLVICRWVLLQAFGNNLVSENYFIRCFGIHHQFDNVEQLTRITTRKTQQGFILFNYNITVFCIRLCKIEHETTNYSVRYWHL